MPWRDNPREISPDHAALKFAIGFFAPFVVFLMVITALGLVGWGQ